jgi:outer membrane protein OmpA-like peptidoglycan-associated protein
VPRCSKSLAAPGKKTLLRAASSLATLLVAASLLSTPSLAQPLTKEQEEARQKQLREKRPPQAPAVAPPAGVPPQQQRRLEQQPPPQRQPNAQTGQPPTVRRGPPERPPGTDQPSRTEQRRIEPPRTQEGRVPRVTPPANTPSILNAPNTRQGQDPRTNPSRVVTPPATQPGGQTPPAPSQEGRRQQGQPPAAITKTAPIVTPTPNATTTPDGARRAAPGNPRGAPSTTTPPPGTPPSITSRPEGTPPLGSGTRAGPPGATGVPGTTPGTPPGAPSGATAVGTQPPAVRPIAGPRQLEQVKSARVQSVNREGQTIIREPGNRTIIKQDNRVYITRNESTSIRTFMPGARTTSRGNGISETVFQRPGGVRVFSEVDARGRLLRRYRRDPSGRDIVIVDNRRFYRNLAIGVGAGVLATAVFIALAPPVHSIPREKYIVDYDRASDDELYEALTAAPVERLERSYSLDEVRYSQPIRERLRRIDLDAINFEFGSFEVSPDQYGKLERLARAIERTLKDNPAEVFLIEGHTDAVGSDDDNLSLSDRRAESVMTVLVERFQLPVENFVTQGYGEQFLKVKTEEADRLNRRVAVRRITPALSQQGPN